MRKLVVLLLCTIALFAQRVEPSKETNLSKSEAFAEQTLQEQRALEQRAKHLGKLKQELAQLDKDVKNNIWIKKYENYKTYYKIKRELDQIEKKIRYYKHKRKYAKKVQELQAKKETLQNQLELLKEYQESPFMEVIRPPKTPNPPKIQNPFDIISAFSYIKQLNSSKEYYLQKLADMESALDLLNKKYQIYKEMVQISPDSVSKEKLQSLKQEIKNFENSLKIAKETLGVYQRKIEENILKTTEEIKIQGGKAIRIAAIIVAIIIFSLLIKWIIRRYIQDNQRAYMANKLINFSIALVIILILLFSYIENVSYLVTILGFASAGIAIAMKDMFMSLLGWMVIVLGGSIHVGDRIKVKKNGLVYVGDVVDISLLRITILEDVTLTSYLHNIRSGRVIFIPNNYIFTDLIANYTHAGLKTVWDNINFNITFDSNHKKAAHIAKEMARKYAKGYTDIARKQLNKLRSTYHLKNTNVDVRVYTFAEEWGIRISLWYMTNSYATLTLRSTISAEVIEKYLQEEDIQITYPAQKIFLTKEDFNDKRVPNTLGAEQA